MLAALMRASALEEHRLGLSIELRAIEYPRSDGQWMLCLELAAFDSEPQRLSTDANNACRFGQVQPSLLCALLG